MYSLDDTIAAISTPIGQGGIGIVRLSGPEALDIALGLFVPAGRALGGGIEPNRLYYGHLVDPETKSAVDEVLLSYMRPPHTYTRQPVVEINAHGGIVPLREILALCLAAGARMAHEGEFTLRAFLSGRIDLAQAEAVLDVVRAKTEASLRVAVDQLGGRLSKGVGSIRDRLLEVLAYLEASIDFPEDEIPARQVDLDLGQIKGQLASLLAEARQGMVYRQGVRTAIVGKPNVGKSSLLNALLRSDRAIVTPIPGTTRDTLEETLSLQGVPLVLVDTAGLGEATHMVERLGMERSRRSIESADLVLLVVDGSQPPTEEDGQVAGLSADKTTIVAVNKSDLPPASGHDRLLPEAPHVRLSAKTGQGIPDLELQVLETVFSGRVIARNQPVASNPRHRDLFRQALERVEEAGEALARGLPADLVAIDVAEAVNALGEITGETASEDLLDRIFSDFCIGK